MLYETHLARARHFLLDVARRQHYNDCLIAYHAGQPFDFAALFESASAGSAAKAVAAPVINPAPAAATAISTAPMTPAEPSAAAPKASKPAVVAPAQASIPATSVAKESPAAVKIAVPTAADTIATPKAEGTVRPAAATADDANVSPGGVATASLAATRNSGEATTAGDTSAQRLEKLLQAPTLRIDAAEDERRRDYRRREMIGAELRARSRVTGLSAAFVLVLCGAAALYPFQNALLSNHGENETGLSGSDLVLIVMAYLLVLGVASVVSWQAARFSRRRIIGWLSRMTYDELLRHCQH
jgi:hypothetical protein